MRKRIPTLAGIRFHQLMSAPRRPDDPQQPDLVPAQLFAATMAAHAELTSSAEEQPMLLAAWERRPGSARIRMVFGGRPLFPPAGRQHWQIGDTAAVLYPPGSTAIAVDSDELISSWHEIPVWLRCTGQADQLWGNTEESKLIKQLRGGFDDYIVHLRDPFVWLVLAEPVSQETTDRELIALELQIPMLRRQENSEERRVALERAQARFRELSRASASGLWNVHILVGAADHGMARQAAALLCGASDLNDLPYVLSPTTETGTLTEMLQSSINNGGPQSPFLATTELVTALARSPKRELPGVRLVERADFDLTQETSGTVLIGQVLDESAQPVDDFLVDTETLNRHVFVTGATGSGKSQTVRHVLQELHRAEIPWLVIEPAKAEYAAMAGRIGAENVVVIHPGAPDDIPVGINPLEPEPGFPLQTHIDLVRALFLAAFEAEEPFPQVLNHALLRCYQDLGWDPAISAPTLPHLTPKYPQLGELRTVALEVIKDIGYSKEITDNVRGFVDVRINSLRLGTPGRFFEGGYPLDIGKLLRRNVVLEIEDIGSDQDKAFFIGAILIRIHEYLRVQQASGNRTPGLQHMLILEEAHRLLKKVESGSPAAHAVELFASLLAEIRAYGTGILVAEQVPDKILSDVIKNTALKIMHRLPAQDDRAAVGATMNLNEDQSRHVVSLPPGRAVVFADRMDRPLRVSIPLGEGNERTATISRQLAVDCIDSSVTDVSRLLTLRQSNEAIRIAQEPRLILWMELLAIAHLVGKPVPQPDASWLATLLETKQHLLDYAIAYRAAEAINTRYQGLSAHFQPEELTKHLIDCASHQLAGLPTPCAENEIHWQAGRYRWVDVMYTLYDKSPKDQPHPDTASWEQRGLRLPHVPQAQQLDALRAHPDLWLPSRSAITGTGKPTLIEAAVARLSNAENETARFTQASAFLKTVEPWPAVVLNLEPPQEKTKKA